MTIDEKLVLSAQTGDLSGVQSALDLGAVVDATISQSTALWWACQEGYIEIARLLVNHGADVNLHDEDGFAPLHQAVGGNHLELTTFLLEHGADANARVHADGNCTALHTAASYGFLECARVLLLHGCDASLKDEDTRETAAEMAKAGGYNELAEMIAFWVG